MSKSKTLRQPQQLRYIAEGVDALKVDEAAGVIRGVKVLGTNSVNRRRYTPEAVSKAQALYEGAPVYVNHPKKAGDMRDYNDRGGVLRATRIVDGELFADLHVNPTTDRGRQLIWEAKECPKTFGLSHTAHGLGREINGVWVCEEISQVHSVDVVTRPATTKGLFESEGVMDDVAMDGTEAPTQSPTAAVEDSFRNAIVAVVDGDGEDKDKLAKIKALLKAKADAISAVTGEPATPPADTPSDGGSSGSSEEPVKESVTRTVAPKGAVALTEEQRELHQLRAEKVARGLLEAAEVAPAQELIEAVAALPEAKRAAFITTLKGMGGKPKLATAKPRSAAPLMESTGEKPVKGPAFASNAQRASFLRS